jgi:glycolate oxidase iron-sulfur subunit
MKTEFTAEQLTAPATAESADAIRKCVHCGFCLATCPTYVLLGDERDSPRGRIYLMKDMLEREQRPTPEVVRHVDRCLSCLSCMTTCPSGVNYMHLVDHARSYIEENYDRPSLDRVLRSVLAWVLPYPSRFRWALRFGRIASPIAPLMRALDRSGRLVALLTLARRGHIANPLAENSRATNGTRGRVIIMKGCAEPVLLPQIRAATVRLLNRLGYDVEFVAGEGCCGALVHHMGRDAEALQFARHNIDVLSRVLEGGPVAALVVTASGCGTLIKDYGFLLRNDPAYAERATRISALAKDISEILEPDQLRELGGGRRLRVAYHAACSLQHGQQIVTQPKVLLEAAGYEVVLPAEGHLCCGSAGTYNVLQPQIAQQLGKRKASQLDALRADVIATGNVGCAVQIAGYSDIPVVHTIELLDWATGGPQPPSMPKHESRE